MARIWHKGISALGLLLALSPVLVVMGGVWLPESPLHWAMWPVGAALLGVLTGLAKGKPRVVLGMAGTAGIVAAAAAWAPGGAWAALAVPSALIFILVLLKAARPPYDEWQFILWLAGAGAHVMGYPAARVAEAGSVIPVLRVLAQAYVPVFLLAVNHMALTLYASARDGSSPPRRIRAGNRRLVIGISAVMLTVVNFAALRDAFYAAGNWLLGMAGRVLAWLAGLFTLETEAPLGRAGSAGVMDLPLGEAASEPSLVWQVLEKIAYAFSAVVCAVLLVLAGILLYRASRRLFARLMARFRGMMALLSEGAQEKTESILDWKEIRDAARLRTQRARRRFARPPKWQAMNNRQRVRWAYGLTMRDSTPQSRTARESLAGWTDGARMADIYDAARYSELTVSEVDAAFMRDAARRGG